MMTLLHKPGFFDIALDIFLPMTVLVPSRHHRDLPVFTFGPHLLLFFFCFSLGWSKYQLNMQSIWLHHTKDLSYTHDTWLWGLSANICMCTVLYVRSNMHLCKKWQLMSPCGFTQMEIEIIAWDEREERSIDGGDTCALLSNWLMAGLMISNVNWRRRTQGRRGLHKERKLGERKTRGIKSTHNMSAHGCINVLSH